MNPDRPRRPPCSPSPKQNRTVESISSARNPVYLDDETLQRMIDTFGPLEYSQFAATLNPQCFVDQDFGGAASWQGEVDWPPQQEIVRRKSKSPRVERPTSPDGRYVLPQCQAEEESSNPKSAEAKKESIIEWFDRSVEMELKKRREPISPTTAVDPALAPLTAMHALNLSKGAAERIAETSASRVEIGARLETDFTTELTDAVEKLAKAENISYYADALQAAEEAAQNAPPEDMERAAAQGARRIEVDLTKVDETIEAIRPIEVLGYVGVTRPHYPKKTS